MCSHHLLRTWRTVPLRALTQGGTLNIRSTKHVNLNIRLIPEWRDDAILHLEQTFPSFTNSRNRVLMNTDYNNASREAHMDVQISHKIGTEASLGRIAPIVTVSVDLKSHFDLASSTKSHLAKSVAENSQEEITNAPHESFGFGNPRDEEVASQKTVENDSNLKRKWSDNLTSDVSNTIELESNLEPSLTLVAKVPVKLNVNCDVKGEGNINVEGKLEGDAIFKCAKGNVTATKLRGHNVSVHVSGSGTINIEKYVEAQTVDLLANEDGRIRVVLIKGADIDIAVVKRNGATLANKGQSGSEPRNTLSIEPLDDDDTQALVDIGSLYASKEGSGAFIAVGVPCGSSNLPRSVRLKSNHGHVSVDAVIHGHARKNLDECGECIPVVDCCGINGSCNVFVKRNETAGLLCTDETKNPIAANVHYDALSPGHVNFVNSNYGDVRLSVDRKIEADVRLLSTPDHVDTDAFLGDDQEQIRSLISNHNFEGQSTQGARRSLVGKITVTAKGFNVGNVFCDDSALSKIVEFVDGFLENKSNEPDSRFDVKARSSAVGKVSKVEAEVQALDGFTKQNYLGNGDFKNDRSLIAVVAAGKIALETASWFGAIAKRYGFPDDSCRKRQ